MTSYDFCVAAKNAIIKTIKETYNEDYTIEDISVVWTCHILGFKKGIFIDNGENNRMYEATFNRDREEMYVDVYQKDLNKVVYKEQIDMVAHT